MKALPRPTLPDGPVRALFDELHDLHHRAGWPSLREMAAEVGCSRTTVAVTFSGTRTPRWRLLELIVQKLGGDTERFHDLWLAAGQVADHPAAAATAARPTAGPPTTASRIDVPRNLPADVIGFTARAEQLAELDDLHLSDGVTIAAICGTAGVGKTALAVHWAHRVSERFPDGQLYVDLRGYDPDKPLGVDEALEVFLRELGVAGAEMPPDVAQRAARYRALLAGRRVLVLLDNANSVDQVRDLLPGTQSGLVLLTSRDTLPGLVVRHGARRIDLGLLPLPDATALLRRLVGRRIDDEPAAAEALAKGCARLPLALRVAAELATSRAGVTLAELVAELDEQQLDLLTAGGDDYTAVRAVFSWSVRQLDDDVARAFVLLGLYPGADLDVPVAAALLDVSLPQARGSLEALARAHLLDRRVRDRFGRHDLLRVYAAELAAELPEPVRHAALTRLFDHYLAAARTGERGWVDAEHGNLAAVSTAARAGWPGITIGLAVALTRKLDTTGYSSEAHDLAGPAVDAARETGDRPAEAAALNLLAQVHARAGRYPASGELFEQALRLHRELGDRSGEGFAEYGIGWLAFRTGAYATALEHLELALRLFRGVGDRASESQMLYTLGATELRLGRHAAALDHELAAVRVSRETGDRFGEACALNNVGQVLLRLCRYDEAQQNYSQALQAFRDVGDWRGESVVLTNIGNLAVELGELDAAMDSFERALPAGVEAGSRLARADALRGLGVVHGRRRRFDQAVDYLDQAVALTAEVGEAQIRTQALNDLGEVLRAAGRDDDAAVAHRAALRLADRSGDPHELSRAQRGLAAAPDDGGRSQVVMLSPSHR